MLKIVNPATEELLREIPQDDPKSVTLKFTAARRAQKSWAALPLATRLEIMNRFRASLAQDKERLAQLLSSEVGKPIAQARNEINGTLSRYDFFAENVGKVLADKVVLADSAQKIEERIGLEPLGVIANISAWNYPYFVGSNVFVPALLAGNAVLYKPSEFATLTGLAIAELLHKAGVPREIFATLVGGAQIGSNLLLQALNGVFFTGSYGTGTKIAESAAKRLMKVQLELGGKDPVYVCEDIDVARVAEGTADGAFYNNGQSCCSVERIYVHERIYDTFVEHFVKTVRGFKIGDPSDEQTYIGPLTRSAQIATLDRQVADAKLKGAHLQCGGQRIARKGYYYEPTVFTQVTHAMELMREESFGPIIGIQKVRDDREALDLMNDTEYGLTAAVYTRDRARAETILAEVNAGSAYWNCCDRVSPRLPWSGRGHSGMGFTLSLAGIETFLQPKAWHLRSP